MLNYLTRLSYLWIHFRTAKQVLNEYVLMVHLWDLGRSTFSHTYNYNKMISSMIWGRNDNPMISNSTRRAIWVKRKQTEDCPLTPSLPLASSFHYVCYIQGTAMDIRATKINKSDAIYVITDSPLKMSRRS